MPDLLVSPPSFRGAEIYVEAQRRPSPGYPTSDGFADPVSALIDEERRDQFENGDAGQTRQLADLTALIAAQSRAASIDAARATADEAQGREQTKRFLAPGAGYVAPSVSLFHD